MTFKSAGSDRDLRNQHLESQIKKYETLARAQMKAAISLYKSAKSQKDLDQAEVSARLALEHYANSLNWAEDTIHEEGAHKQMDSAGKWVRLNLRCNLLHEDGSYFQTCPVALGHNRIGLSIGAIANRVCSLCGEDLSECLHLPGIAYLVPGGIEDLGRCRVCLSTEACQHLPTEEYRVSVVGISVSGEILEVSIVNKPAHPEARFQKISLSNAELKEFLGDGFEIGMEVSCDRCLTECDGLTRHEDFPSKI